MKAFTGISRSELNEAGIGKGSELYMSLKDGARYTLIGIIFYPKKTAKLGSKPKEIDSEIKKATTDKIKDWLKANQDYFVAHLFKSHDSGDVKAGVCKIDDSIEFGDECTAKKTGTKGDYDTFEMIGEEEVVKPKKKGKLT